MSGVPHGESHTRLYGVWLAMRRRCFLPTDSSYSRYGERGIIVCPEWRDSYTTFRDWSLAHGYAEGLSIERKNNSGNYEPSNCSWETPETQANNRRSNRMIEAFGEIKTAANWARDARTVVSYNTILRRIDRHGWSAEDAITTPNLGTGRGRNSKEK